MSVLISLTTKKHIHAEVAKWLMRHYEAYSIDIVISPNPLEHARNEQVSRFLNTHHDYLFIVDSDCVPAPNTINTLSRLNLPFVAAPHPAIKGNETGVMVLDRVSQNDYIQHTPFNKGLQVCDAVGCAGMMIHREIFEKLDKPYFKFVYDENGFLVKGEDFDFCDRIKELGYKVYVHCDLIQTHYVGVSI